MISWAEFRKDFISIPNCLSVLRGLLAVSLPFLLYSANPWMHVVALLVFVVGVLTDFLDGVIARKFSMESRAGKLLDPVMDKLLILTPMVVFALQGLFSLWWVVPIMIRELVVTFSRIGWLMEGEVIAAEKAGKLKLGFQVGMIGAAFVASLANEVGFLQFAYGFFLRADVFCACLSRYLNLVFGCFVFHSQSGIVKTAGVS